jgi:hypothetical protein
VTLAGHTLFLAGAPDVVDGEDPWAAYHGRLGGVLWAAAAVDGGKLAEYDLDAPPVYDGMAVSGGRLYLSTSDGRILCMGSRRQTGKEIRLPRRLHVDLKVQVPSGILAGCFTP